jgi:hypothetical protein
MQRIIHYKGKWWIAGFMAIGLLLIILISLIIPPASAAILVYGSEPNFSAVTLPNNSYVYQGDNITQGNYYDLSGVYGFTGKIAHWKNDNGMDTNDPEVIINLEHPRSVFIDPETFPVGRYFQCDGKISGSCSSFEHGNTYVFHVSAPLDPIVTIREKVVVYTSNITIVQNGTEIQIPVTLTQVQTYTVAPTPTPETMGTIIVVTPEPQETQIIAGDPNSAAAVDRNGNPIVGGVSGAIPVTARAPLSISVIIVAVVAAMVAGRKRE